MKTSWNRCMEFSQYAQDYLRSREGKPDTKLGYALNRVLKRVVAHNSTVEERLGDIEIDHCVTESRNGEDVIVRDGQGNLQYTKDGLKKRNAARTVFLAANEIEVESHFATKLPDDLNFAQVEAFAGFVIREDEAERLLVEMENKLESETTSSDGEKAQAASA